MKISILSVAPPYRGGIAEQTYHLCMNLKDNHSIEIINFKKQYPKFLFPGKTQFDNFSKLHLENSYRFVDSTNPFSWIKTSKYIINSGPDVVILRFWNPFFSISYSSIIKKIKKALPKTKVIAICDNIIPHERSFFDRGLINLLFKYIDGFIVMSDQVEEELLLIRPDSRYKKLFHPITPKQQKYTKQAAKDKLGIREKKVILFFGFIRGYKGLDILIKSNK